MFPMCTSNDPARFALKKKIFTLFEIFEPFCARVLFRHGILGWFQINVS